MAATAAGGGGLDRRSAARLGAETLQILQDGRYTTPTGISVDLRQSLASAVQTTVSYPPDHDVEAAPVRRHDTTVEVRNETTLDAARRLTAAGHIPVALNFASAKHPGGGFLSGARAQEESLARASGLYACLRGQSMYEHHRRLRDPLYTAWAIYSPAVPVFRDERGALLETPYECAFITAPAVNAKVVLARDPSRRAEVSAAMRERVTRVLAVATIHEHDAIVLGAWGCGVFGNDPGDIAQLFHDALGTRFNGTFRRVVFAIVDWSSDRRFIEPFRRRFGT